MVPRNQLDPAHDATSAAPAAAASTTPASGAGLARVTVVIPCYNQSHFLGECLESVRAQTLTDWEAVVVDDTSPDGDDIRRVVEEIDDPRIRLVRHEANKGLGGSRNTGIREATTALVYPLDSDDRIAPRCLELLVGAFEADPELHCAYADVQLFGCFDEVLAFPGPPPGKPLVKAEHTIPGAGTMMRKTLWEGLGGYDEADVLRRGREDFEFWIRAFQEGCRFRRVEEPLYEYRHLQASMNVTCRLQDHEIADYIYGKHKALFDGEGEGKNFRCFWLAKAARASYLEGYRWRAFQLSMRSWRLLPSRSRLEGAVRSLLKYSTNEAINAGEIRRRIPFAGYPLRGKKANPRPFFVIGTDCSGGATLAQLLGAHSKLHVPPASVVMGECLRKFRRYSRSLNWPDLVNWVFAKFRFHEDFASFGMDIDELVARLSWVPVGERNLAHLIDAFYREHAARSRAGEGVDAVEDEPERWGDWTPRTSLDDALQLGDRVDRVGRGRPDTLERLARVFPAAQFLHVQRDGCDVVHSMLRRGFFATIPDAAERWLHVESQIERFAGDRGASVMKVRYEELFHDRERVLADVSTFLGVEVESAMLATDPLTASVSDESDPGAAARVPGRGRAAFSPDERARLHELLGPMLGQLGYPPAQSID